MIRCIAIDDEPIALSILSNYAERMGGISLETFSSPRAGMARIAATTPDVVLLDIEMKGTSGIDLARQLPPGTCLIFTTAYAQYAIDGFELNAVDFLHKPYFFPRFCRAIQKAEQWIAARAAASATDAPKLTLTVDYKTLLLPTDQILYIEAMQNYVKVHLATGKVVISQIPLHVVESQLPAGKFVRTHRSFIVACSAVATVSHTAITLNGTAETIPVGRKYAPAAIAALNNLIGK